MIWLDKTDTFNQKYTRTEEEEAKKELRDERGENTYVPDMEWREVLQKILVAIWKVKDEEKAAFKTTQMADRGIEGINRGCASILELAQELERTLKFARWQSQIFQPGARLPETW